MRAARKEEEKEKDGDEEMTGATATSTARACQWNYRSVPIIKRVSPIVVSLSRLGRE